jgi:anti-sigma regulatory factor (Ser/Thr protein kinase)
LGIMMRRTPTPADRSDARWFRASPPSVAKAREFVRGCMADAHAADCVVEDAQLVVSELATNALRHTGTRFCVTVDIRPAGEDTLIRVGVEDQDPTPPVVRQAAPDAVSGRGLQIVDQCADFWGHHGLATGGKVVFAELRVPTR